MVGAALEAALDNCRAMRTAEGQALQKVLTEAQQRLAELREAMHAAAEERVPRQAERLRSRLDELVHDGIDENRLAHEVGCFAC